MALNAIIAPRVAADRHAGCDCCGRWRRVAKIWLDRIDGVDVRRAPLLCSACLRAAWDAAKKAVAS
jgi:hypothetical protein